MAFSIIVYGKIINYQIVTSDFFNFHNLMNDYRYTSTSNIQNFGYIILTIIISIFSYNFIEKNFVIIHTTLNLN